MFTSSSDLQEKLRESLLIRYKNLGKKLNLRCPDLAHTLSPNLDSLAIANTLCGLRL